MARNHKQTCSRRRMVEDWESARLVADIHIPRSLTFENGSATFPPQLQRPTALLLSLNVPSYYIQREVGGCFLRLVCLSGTSLVQASTYANPLNDHSTSIG